MLHSSPTFTPSMAGGEHAGCWCHGQPRQAAHHHHHDHRTPVPSPSLAFSDVDEVCRALWAELLSMDSQAQQHSPSTAASSEDQLSIQEVQDVLRQCVADSEADGDRAASASRPQGADAAANTSVSCSCCPRPARSGHTTPTSGRSSPYYYYRASPSTVRHSCACGDEGMTCCMRAVSPTHGHAGLGFASTAPVPALTRNTTAACSGVCSQEGRNSVVCREAGPCFIGAGHFGHAEWGRPAVSAHTHVAHSAGCTPEAAAALISPLSADVIQSPVALTAVRRPSTDIDLATCAVLTPPASSADSPAFLSSGLDWDALESSELSFDLDFSLDAPLSVSLDSLMGEKPAETAAVNVESPNTPAAEDTAVRDSGTSGAEVSESSAVSKASDTAAAAVTPVKKSRSKSPVAGTAANGGSPVTCANCGTAETVRWRISLRGEANCNACGIYERSKGVPRPREMIRRDKRRQERTLAAYLKGSKPVEGCCSCTCGGCLHASAVKSPGSPRES